MTLKELIDVATVKDNFYDLDAYADFCDAYLSFIRDEHQAIIVSQNEHNYIFFQYKEDGNYAVTRPVNSDIMLTAENFESSRKQFYQALKNIHDIRYDPEARQTVNRFIYTCQQAIGATLDALPVGASNTARKINGDLFERYIRMIIRAVGIDVEEGTVNIPVVHDGEELFSMAYQHDLILKGRDGIKAIGSVKTSSKDRIDKIFIDKFLYNRLTEKNTPHFAVFLNDVQRKGKEPNYGVNTTFLTGHFKGYTVKLTPLDGVYYCDLRPVMKTDKLLSRTIRSLDCLLVEDIWKF